MFGALFKRSAQMPVTGKATLVAKASNRAEQVRFLLGLERALMKGMGTLGDSGSHTPPNDVARRLAARISEQPDSWQRWAGLLLFESRALRGQFRIFLLDRIAECGVYRDVSDLPPTSGNTTALVLAAALELFKQHSSPVLSLLQAGLQEGTVTSPTPADATVLAYAIPSQTLSRLQQVPEAAGLNDMLALAAWISGLRQTNSLMQFPSSDLANRWLGVRAFRGLRRHWARARGAHAGRASVSELDLGLLATAPNTAEGLGVMIVEWALSTINAWPDRVGMVADDIPEARDRANALCAASEKALRLCQHSTSLITWLKDGAKTLTRTPIEQRRIRMTAN